MAIMKFARSLMDQITGAGNVGCEVYTSDIHKQAYPSVGIFPFGLVSKPIAESHGIQAQVGGDSAYCILGYVHKTTGKIHEGEIMIYSKDKDGNLMASVILKSDGEIEAVSMIGNSSVIMKANGDVEASGENVRLRAAEVVEMTGSSREALIIP
jgi:hypothetical protein